MNKIKELLKNKKFLITFGIIVLILIIVIVIVIVLDKNNQLKEDIQEETLKNQIKEMGIHFYEDYYYDNIDMDEEKRTKLLENYVTLGIKVDLDDLSKFSEEGSEAVLAKFVNDKTGEPCDKTNSKAIIRPQDPFGKTDYEIEVILECGFEKEEEK